MEQIFRREPDAPLTPENVSRLRETEWLVTNGLGGYASGTVGGILTRVFHGYLIAALSSPLGRTMMLNDLLEELVFPDGEHITLNGVQTTEGKPVESGRYLTRFYLDVGLPVWVYELKNITLEKRVYLSHRQNTTYVNYRMSAGQGSFQLRIRPAVNMREHEAPVSSAVGEYKVTISDRHYEIQCEKDLPPLRLKVVGQDGGFSVDQVKICDVVYDVEKSRGYAWKGDLWSPGWLTMKIDPRHDATIVASTEVAEVMSALMPRPAWDAEHDRKRRLLIEAHPGVCDETCRELVWAADQFIFAPVGRRQDTARARAAGDDIRSIIAGYHWFTDWGRDTMISLEGLTLTTGRTGEASYILRTFAHYIKDGLIPNLFPEGKSDGLYHTADATLWFFHAFHRYMQYSKDRHLMAHMLPKLIDIVGQHLRGTHFNIHVDHNDGLLSQGQTGYQLTWMDAKVGDWVVTPRRGKAVEINALWYNALKLLEGWLRECGREEEANGLKGHAAKARESFNKRFWNEQAGFLYDVVDGPEQAVDPSCRPNQIFAISLDHPVLEERYWQPVLQVVQERLLTPVGLRSLAPGEKDYKPNYDGDLHSRDAAYHQGTVWAWLIGPFIDAWLKVRPNDYEGARGCLQGFKSHLTSACVGSISEIFDAEPPFKPRGCCAQAWSVAEVLRAFAKTSGAIGRHSEEELVTATVI